MSSAVNNLSLCLGNSEACLLMNLPMEDNEAMELPVDPADLLPVDPAAMLLPDSCVSAPVSRMRCVMCYATAGNFKERRKLSLVRPTLFYRTYLYTTLYTEFFLSQSHYIFDFIFMLCI